MSLQSFLKAAEAEAKIIEQDAVAFLTKVYRSVEGTPAMKTLETVAVDSLAVPVEAAVATLLPAPFSAAVVGLIQELVAQVEKEISAQQPPTPAIPAPAPGQPTPADGS